ncbi:DUF1552 domain-containing protein [Roseiconus nitratireducens]|nr:DUF1552 domain-containing protein [Roseiconus nitratireducens]
MRLAWVYIPNGVVQDSWHPTREGRSWELTESLQPLEDVRDSLNLFTGLDREFRGGTGVHAQAGCCWLTSSPPTEALDGGFPTNKTLDWLISEQISGDTVLPTLGLSCNDHANQKETRYFETLSWRGPGYAVGPQKDPKEVFELLFGKPRQSTKSVLDIVREDASRLSKTLGAGDREKLGEYLDSVRGLEKRIQRAEQRTGSGISDPGPQFFPVKETSSKGIPDDRGQYIRLMGDLIALAFQQDLTRVATLLIDPERWDTPRMYHGVFDRPENHHVLTHTKGDEAKEKLRKIDRFHVEQYAYLVKRLAEIKEADGTLLDHCLISLGSGMGDGRVHDYNNLPVITAGRLGGRISPGAHYKFDGKVPLANLWLTLLQGVGAEADTFADSTGRIAEVLT